MGELKEKILAELSDLEAAVLFQRGAPRDANAQTDLEVAILTRQLAEQRASNLKAAKYIDDSLNILKRLAADTNH
jgi:hypothetical protein